MHRLNRTKIVLATMILIIFLIIIATSLSSALQVHRVEASGTIYIRADGSIDPPDAPISTLDNITYTLTDNITSDADGIVIERDNIVVDGAGHTVTGSANGNGATLTYRSNVTTRNMTIENFTYGIRLDSSFNNTLFGNNLSGNDLEGIRLTLSSDNVLSGNAIEGSQFNFIIYGPALSDYINFVDTSNLVNGKPIYYLMNQSNIVIGPDAYPEVGYLGLVNCANVTVQGLNLTGPGDELLLAFTNNSKITGNNVTNKCVGISLGHSSSITLSDNNITNNVRGVQSSDSSNITLSGNNITYNKQFGVYVDSSSNITLSGNNVTNNDRGIMLFWWSENNTLSGNNVANNGNGIDLFQGSGYNTLSGNNVANNTSGIGLGRSSCNILSGNNVTNNEYGIGLYGSSYNTLTGNNVTNNGNGIILSNFVLGSYDNSVIGNNIASSRCGIDLSGCSGNRIFHNNFLNNTEQASNSSVNVWDDGYPSGGNYWSDYKGIDADPDGIGDTPYVIDVNNTDDCPLMGMFYSYNVTYYTPPIVPHTCNVTVISNSTISDFVAPIWIEHLEVIFLQFNVSGAEGSNGFCRVSFPTAMMNGTYHVSLNGTEIPYTLLPCSDANTSYLYFNYTHSTQEVTIIPEFPSFTILPLFFMATLLAVITCRRKHR